LNRIIIIVNIHCCNNNVLLHFCKMLKKLQELWKVNFLNLALILLTFALGGSLCGWAGRKILLLTSLEKGIIWVLLYIILITLLWPLCVLIISIPLGQYSFFKKYIFKIINKFSGGKTRGEINKAKVNMAIFASGTGSNAKRIIGHFSDPKSPARVALIICNNPHAGVLKIAAENNIPFLVIEREKFMSGDGYLPEMNKYGIDLIVLAGFLWKIPVTLIKAFPKKIINIHPALLPKYGGKGMYGHHVHETVIANKEKESGISIHYVDEIYDHGEIIFQATCKITASETVESLTAKIQQLEHQHYARVIEELLQKQNMR